MPRLAPPALLLLAACVSGACASGKSAAPPPDPTLVTQRTTSITTTTGTVEARLTTQDQAQGTTLKVPSVTAWKMLPAVYGDLALPVTTYLTQDRQIASKNNRVRGRIGNLRVSSIVSCGSDMLGEDKANSYEVTLEVTTTVTDAASPDQARLTSLVTATARPMATSGDLLHCASTGQLEKRIANAVLVKSAGQ